MRKKESAILFLNGEMDLTKKFYKNFFEDNKDDVYCADGGLRFARELNLTPKEVWGDLDSVSKEDVAWSIENKSIIKRFPSEKNETDGELLIRYLKERSYDIIKVFSGTGGRTDHFLTNLNLAFNYEGIEFYNDKEKIIVLKEKTILKEIIGKTISFIPFTDEVTGLTLKGVKYPLHNFILKRGSSRCMSNVASENEVYVEYEKGKLLCIIENI